MIPAVHPRGTQVRGLLGYLFGPGKREEHVDPHIVAAWDGAGPLAHADIRHLAELLEQPVRSGWNPPAKTVWHCSIRTHPDDRHLSDGQWAHIAGEVMAAVDLARHGDSAAVRWIAVRHGDDHIHLVATLVRQDRRTAWAWKDKLHAQQACRQLEERYGLHRIAPPGHGALGWPLPSEIKKAGRLGRPRPPRVELRDRVRAAAADASDEAQFFAWLEHDGVIVRRRFSTVDPRVTTGYAVALPEHMTAAGEPVWYSGGRLGANLTLPRLRARWDHIAVSGVADIVAALGSSRGRPLNNAAVWLRRAAEGRLSATRRLGAMARLVAATARMTDNDDLIAVLQLIDHIAAFADYLAAIHDADRQAVRAQAARMAALQLRGSRSDDVPLDVLQAAKDLNRRTRHR